MILVYLLMHSYVCRWVYTHDILVHVWSCVCSDVPMCLSPELGSYPPVSWRNEALGLLREGEVGGEMLGQTQPMAPLADVVRAARGFFQLEIEGT